MTEGKFSPIFGLVFFKVLKRRCSNKDADMGGRKTPAFCASEQTRVVELIEFQQKSRGWTRVESVRDTIETAAGTWPMCQRTPLASGT